MIFWNREFDIVECVGVLHHMRDPEAGLRVLADLLKPGGLIKLGLYSETARAQLASSRRKAGHLGAEPTDSQIREYRRRLLDAGGEELEALCEWSDFFNLSEWRDLIFHVQEHQFSLSQIDRLLDAAEEFRSWRLAGVRGAGPERAGINSGASSHNVSE